MWVGNADTWAFVPKTEKLRPYETAPLTTKWPQQKPNAGTQVSPSKPMTPGRPEEGQHPSNAFAKAPRERFGSGNPTPPSNSKSLSPGAYARADPPAQEALAYAPAASESAGSGPGGGADDVAMGALFDAVTGGPLARVVSGSSAGGGSVARTPLEVGTRVELWGRDQGFEGSWYTAEVMAIAGVALALRSMSCW